LDGSRLARGFQATQANQLVGLDGRVALLRRLGSTIAANRTVFGTPARLGNLVDHLEWLAPDGRVRAARVLAVVLDAFADIWPSRIKLGGAELGDVGRHRVARTDDLASGPGPFPKLPQVLRPPLLRAPGPTG